MTTTTRTIKFTVDPAFAAYCEWLEADSSRTFELHDYDLFAAGYRRRSDELESPLPAAGTGDGGTV